MDQPPPQVPAPNLEGDVVVVGRGLLGSAAARHLSDLGARVVVVGPEEPADRASHEGVFASHYDSARITRVIDRDPYYARIAAASIARYRGLEERTGISFYHDVGHMAVTAMRGYFDDLVDQADAHGLHYQLLDGPRLAQRFPYLRFAAGMRAIYEIGTGGFIDPRRFIEAQCRAVALAGGAVVSSTVTSVEPGPRPVVMTDDGRRITANQVLVATGAFANHFEVLPQPIVFDVHEHTVVLAELDEAGATELVGMPSIIYKRGEEVGQSVYLLPPVVYPDGRSYVKIGQSTGRRMADPSSQLIPWFQGTGDADIAAWLLDELRALLPDIWLGAVHRDSCVVTQSPSGRQFIDCFEGTSIYTLLADNGLVAKSADELGRIAAHRLLNRRVPPEYRDENFAMVRR